MHRFLPPVRLALLAATAVSLTTCTEDGPTRPNTGTAELAIAGAPANNWVALLSSDMMNTLAMMKDPGSRLPPTKLKVLHQ